MPYFVGDLRIGAFPIPYTQDIFALPDAYSTSTNLRLTATQAGTDLTATVTPCAFTLVCRYVPTIVELIADNSEDNVLPQSIGNAFLQADNPLSPGRVNRIFPDGSFDARVK